MTDLTMDAVPTVRMQWATPQIEMTILRIARLSNPGNEDSPHTRLLARCIERGEWSVFEMANICMEVIAPRDVTRQILRHGIAFRFQEFSQRYASVDLLPHAPERRARLQDPRNRQASITLDNDDWRVKRWDALQGAVTASIRRAYDEALSMGIAKEVARSVLPEGLTSSRMYMNGNVRSWLHFCALRTKPGTQPETMEVAHMCWDVFRECCPIIADAWQNHIAPRAESIVS